MNTHAQEQTRRARGRAGARLPVNACLAICPIRHNSARVPGDQFMAPSPWQVASTDVRSWKARPEPLPATARRRSLDCVS